MYVIKCTAIGQGANKDVKPSVCYFGKRENFSSGLDEEFITTYGYKGYDSACNACWRLRKKPDYEGTPFWKWEIEVVEV